MGWNASRAEPGQRISSVRRLFVFCEDDKDDVRTIEGFGQSGDAQGDGEEVECVGSVYVVIVTRTVK